MKNYYRVMLGRKSVHAPICFAENFIGVDFGIDQDLTGQLPTEWREFNRKFIPVFLDKHPEKTKIGAGLACGVVWTVSKGILKGDVVLCPDGAGSYHLGEVEGDYSYQAGSIFPHQRAVKWLEQSIDRSDMSVSLKGSTGSIGTVSNISKYRDEIENLLGNATGAIPTSPGSMPGEEAVENDAAFAMEKHLEDFLVRNWAQTELGKEYNIYAEDGERVGQQYPTDTGPLDILAISKDKKSLLVVELKRGRASDAVVGQILRYMGYVKEELAEAGQTVRGVIIALEDDPKMRRALVMVANIEFYRYQISFKLIKV